MKVVNEVMPTDPERIAAMQEPGPEGPIVMVNLLRFRDRAQYADGRETTLSGAEAYGIYGAAVSELIQKFGGQVIFGSEVTFLSIGQVEDLWDAVALARYPNRGALWSMATSPEYQEIAVHREAGLAGQLNIETANASGLGLGTR